MTSNKEFDVWLSFGFDGDAIPTKDGRLTRDNLLGTTAIGADYYTKVIKGTFQTRFDETADLLRRKVMDGMDLHADQGHVRRTAAPGVVPVSDVLGGADFPNQKMWDQPSKLLVEARNLNKGGNIVQASKRLAQGAMLADLAGARLNEYIDATVKGAARAVFAAKVVVVVTSIIEAALNVYLLATVVTELAAGEVVVETVVEEGGKRIVKRRVRKEITREAFDKMLARGKSTFRRGSPLGEDLRGAWLEDMKKIWEAAERRGIELTQKELDTLFEAAQHKWYGPR
jgi:hypothetical protein